MISKEKIERINALARKKKAEGLTGEEAEEQMALRAEYVAAVRKNLKAQLDNIEIIRPDYEDGYTEADKQHIAELSAKLEAEYKAAHPEADRFSITEAGNPSKPQGEAGKVMIARMNDSHSDMTAWAFDFLPLKPDDTVLDVGCGGGAALKRLSGRIKGGKLYGIDYSDVSVEASRKLNQKDVDSGKMTIIEASVSDLPFDDATFDAIVTVESYYFWPDIEHDMQEVFRVLKKGGTFLMVAEMYMHDELDEAHIASGKKYGLRNFTIDEFTELFEKTGFDTCDVHLKKGEYWICVEGRK